MVRGPDPAIRPHYSAPVRLREDPMKKARGKWSWSQLDRGDSEIISVMLVKNSHSLAVILPRPDGWVGDRTEDREIIRSILFEAAEEPWSRSQAGD